MHCEPSAWVASAVSNRSYEYFLSGRYVPACGVPRQLLRRAGRPALWTLAAAWEEPVLHVWTSGFELSFLLLTLYVAPKLNNNSRAGEGGDL